MPRRRHLYGDVYSSPGLALRQKQVLMVAFLGQADMHEQLFGHLLAVCAWRRRACPLACLPGFPFQDVLAASGEPADSMPQFDAMHARIACTLDAMPTPCLSSLANKPERAHKVYLVAGCACRCHARPLSGLTCTCQAG